MSEQRIRFGQSCCQMGGTWLESSAPLQICAGRSALVLRSTGALAACRNTRAAEGSQPSRLTGPTRVPPAECRVAPEHGLQARGPHALPGRRPVFHRRPWVFQPAARLRDPTAASCIQALDQRHPQRLHKGREILSTSRLRLPPVRAAALSVHLESTVSSTKPRAAHGLAPRSAPRFRPSAKPLVGKHQPRCLTPKWTHFQSHPNQWATPHCARHRGRSAQS